jgi:hypothetical protein
MKHKIIDDDDEESLDELVKRARSDKELKKLMRNSKYGIRKEMRLKGIRRYELFELFAGKNTCVCVGDQYIVIGREDGRVMLYGHNSAIMNEEHFWDDGDKILMMDMPTNNLLLCYVHSESDTNNLVKIGVDPKDFKAREPIIVPSNPSALSSSQSEAHLICGNGKYTFKLDDWRNWRESTQHKLLAVGPNNRMLYASETALDMFPAIKFDEFIENPKLFKLQFRKNLVATAYKSKSMGSDVWGVAFFQVDYPNLGMNRLEPLLIEGVDGDVLPERKRESGLHEYAMEINDISMSPSGKYFGILLKGRYLDLYEIK